MMPFKSRLLLFPIILRHVPIYILLLALFLFLPKDSVYAMGISPGVLNAKLFRGTSQEHAVTILRSPEDIGDVTIDVEKAGVNADLVKLTDTTFVMPAKESQYVYHFSVSSGNFQNGTFDGNIIFVKRSNQTAGLENHQGAGSAIRVGVKLKIPITIDGTQIVAYQFHSVEAEDTEVGMETQVHYKVSNKGNVDWRPTRIQLTFSDVLNPAFAVSAEVKDEQIPFSKAGGADQLLYIHANPNLPIGLYGVSADFYDGDKKIATLQSSNKFNVYPEGTLKQSAELVSVKVNKDTFKPGEKIKLEAEYQNTGELRQTVVLYASVNKNGEFIDLVRGNEYTVSAHSTETFTQILSYTDPGDYSVDLYAEFSKKKTALKNITFKIASGLSVSSNAKKIILIGGGIIFSIAFVIILLLLLLKKRKKKTEKKSVQKKISEQTQKKNHKKPKKKK